jgi:hypothetical protein
MSVKFTKEEFFNHEINLGLHPANENFYQVHKRIADYILTYEPKSHIDICAGNSPITEILLNELLDAWAYDQNDLSKSIFDSRNPTLTERYVLGDISSLWDKMKGKKFDFATSIEAFEHVPDELLIPAIKGISKNCKYFLFSSTPHHSTPEFDEQWGHINLKDEKGWIDLFEGNGFKFLRDKTIQIQFASIPTPWALMFESVNFQK